MPVEDLYAPPAGVGDFLRVTLRERQEDGYWSADWAEGPTGWSVLASDRDTRGWWSGRVVRARVYLIDVEQRTLWLTPSDFGFMAVSAKMRPRYLAAAEVVSSYLETGETVDPSALAGFLSEAKGIANRCVRMDQWDWFDVWCGLGRPDRGEVLRPAAGALWALRVAVRDSDWREAEGQRKRLLALGFAEGLRSLLTQLKASGHTSG